MNVLFLGGSNFVIKNGISTQVPDALAASGCKINNVFNISVGATGSLFGIENFSLFGKKDIDLVFIEYGINDLPAYGNDKFLWEISFEYLIQSVRAKYPLAHIVVVLLGREPEKFWKSQFGMHKAMAEVSKRAGCLVIDVNARIKSKAKILGKLADFYSDDSHYLSPNVTSYIARYIVSEYLLFSQMGMFDSKNKKSLNPKYDFKLSSVSGDVFCFENNRFKTYSSKIEVGSTVEMEVPGVPVAVSFVSTKGSSSLLLEIEGKKKIVNTLRRLQESSKLPFIIKQIPLYKLIDKGEEFRPQKLKLTPLNKESEAWDGSIMQKTYGMVPSDSNKGGCVLVSHIMSVCKL
ncbi:SGNH/GDSL hydrolase family protein [Halomonas sp. DWK9]|uniref:SGNH/GDSL hydrolase family protein n=1 Tax=Halomonas sp. DWK9 TaxID=3060155 RepID=UPI00287FE307|nr:SGNH/GDSL hydrolase family protein [Halomonas sp. DWK9]